MSETGPQMVFEPQSHRSTFEVSGVAPLEDQTITIDLGYKNATDLYIPSDPPKPEELSAALSVVELHLDDVVRELNSVRSGDDGRSAFEMTVRDSVVIGVGPIFVSLAALELGELSDKIDGFELTREAAEDVFRTVATESDQDRQFNPGLDPQWSPLIVGGTCLVVEAFRCWGLEKIVVSHPQEVPSD